MPEGAIPEAVARRYAADRRPARFPYGGMADPLDAPAKLSVVLAKALDEGMRYAVIVVPQDDADLYAELTDAMHWRVVAVWLEGMQTGCVRVLLRYEAP